MVKETEGKKTISLLDVDTVEERIIVNCFDGTVVFGKNEDLAARLYDTTNHISKIKFDD